MTHVVLMHQFKNESIDCQSVQVCECVMFGWMVTTVRTLHHHIGMWNTLIVYIHIAHVFNIYIYIIFGSQLANKSHTQTYLFIYFRNIIDVASYEEMYESYGLFNIFTIDLYAHTTLMNFTRRFWMDVIWNGMKKQNHQIKSILIYVYMIFFSFLYVWQILHILYFLTSVSKHIFFIHTHIHIMVSSCVCVMISIECWSSWNEIQIK